MGVLEDEGQPSAKRPKLSTLESDSSAAFTDSGAPCAAVTSPGKTDMAGKLYMNGGGCQEAERLGSKQQIDKVEFVRLITQALYSLGYDNTAQHLESESRISLQSKPVTEFRAGVLEGRWEHCLQLLTDMHVDGADLQNAKFLLFQQFFLELLEANDTSQALKVLRSSVSPLGIHTKRIHQLASWVICSSPDHLRQTAQWSGKDGDSRYKLLIDLQGLLPPSFLIPERRLEDLVEQSLDCQKSKCAYHNSNTASFTLFTDHMCGRDSIPSVTVKVLEGHEDEVWCLHFSHSGTRLASASKDTTAIVWEVNNGEDACCAHVLRGHTKALSFVAWSPDDTLLLTCGNDELVKLWDTETGECLRTYNKHTMNVTSCAWFPDGQRFMTGSLDKHMYMWHIDGRELKAWKGQDRVNDLALSPEGTHLVSLCNEKEVHFHNLGDGSSVCAKQEESVTSLAMARDGGALLVNLSSGSIQLWDHIQAPIPPTQPAMKYNGQVQGRFVIRSCFGGTEEAFVVSGSEDSQVYIWHRPTGELLEVLAGHSGTVNAVTWSPTNSHMMASASDDRTVRLWGVRKRPTTPPSLANAGGGVGGVERRGGVAQNGDGR